MSHTWNFSVTDLKLLSHDQLFVTPWTVACQDPLAMEQGDCSGFPFPYPGDPLSSGIEPGSPALQANSLPSEPPSNVGYEHTGIVMSIIPEHSSHSYCFL